MKKLIFILVALATTNSMFAQVGIGTKAPETDLHVAGSLIVQDKFRVRSLSTVTAADEDFKLLAWSKDSSIPGMLTQLDVDVIDVAPVNTIDYHFKDISLDNLSDVDLQYDTSKYIVGIANFRYVGDAIVKQNTNSDTAKSIGQFVTRAFEANGTWHLEIKNRSLDIDVSESVEYYVTLIVYNKSYFRGMPKITTDLNGGFTGTASSTPDLD